MTIVRSLRARDDLGLSYRDEQQEKIRLGEECVVMFGHWGISFNMLETYLGTEFGPSY
jgi:hypothetical protein